MRAIVASLACSWFIFVATASRPLAATFSIEVVSTNLPPGCNPSLALAADGTPSVAYNNGGGAILAHKSDPFWTFEPVANYAFVQSTRSLAIASTGDPVIAVHYQSYAQVATRTGGVWSFEQFWGLDPWTMTLALDHNDGAHIVNVWSWGSGLYSGFVDYDFERVSQTIFIPTNPCLSLALDSHEVPHIVHTPSEGVAMLYWTQVGDDWVSETLPIGTGGVVAVDASDGLHMVYYDHVNGDLVYGTRGAGGWNFTTIDYVGDVGKSPSLAIDGLGRPHVSYYDVTNQDLRYAILVSGSWQRQIVDAYGDVGSQSSIAIHDALPSIAYYDGRRYVKLATGQTPTPSSRMTWGSVKALYDKR